MRRVEDPRFLAGQGQYVEDVQPRDVLYLVFVRSPYPSARIASLDVEAARSSPGVVAVLTSADLGAVGDVPCIPLPFAKVPPFPPLARGYVAAVGTPVVAIVAESSAAAYDAAELVQIEYEPLAAVSYAETALEPGAPKVHPSLDSNLCYTLKKAGGDVERAFQEADVTVKLRVDSPRVAPVPLEPRAVVVEPGAADSPTRLTVRVTSQAPHGARADLARVLGLQPDQVRVISPDVGGGFGAKSGATPEYILACHLALQLGQPIKWVATRGEDMQVTTQGRDMLIYVELAAKRDGTVTGLKLRNIANMGAYLHSATAIPPTFILSMGGGCYRIANVEVETNAVFTNTPSTGPYRGAGRPESVLAIERGMDALARELGMDPIELRRKNFIQPDEFPYTVALGVAYDSGNYGGALDKALELANYDALLEERDAARERGELMGIGISTFVEPSGSIGGETGLVRVEPDGRVTLVTGSHSHGQGHETSFAQVVADQMSVPLQQVRVVHGDTAEIERGTGTFASRSMMLGGSAAFVAATKVVDKARRIAAHELEATIDDIEL
ncbi:MAG TPA: xanthine dehydrogenase family protein molybdopterin-binding subunit, partial [Chloroflexota bacterium]